VDLSITFLGTAASAPSARRGTAATLIARGGERILVDCGEGTQRQLLRSGHGLVDLDTILLTHLHADHILGLPGLLKSYGLRDREREILIVGPSGTKTFLERLAPVIGRLPFRMTVEEWRPADELSVEGGAIAAFATEHRVPSIGFALVEDSRPGAFDIAQAKALGVPEGPDFGRLQRGEIIETATGEVRPEQVLGSPRSGRRIVLSGDTEPCGATIDAAKGADLLVHEATFVEADRPRADKTGHSTARDAALVAVAAKVSLLALTHISPRNMVREIRAEAEAAFSPTIIPRDFDRVEIPYPERGAPRHIAWSAERRASLDVEAIESSQEHL
jgi:ribonuclease Z